MRAIVAGGRNFCWSFAQNRLYLPDNDIRKKAEWYLSVIFLKHGVDFVLCGGATGADALGLAFAKERGIHGMIYNAKWSDLTVPGAVVKTRRNTGEKYNSVAGPQRNERMAAEAGLCILFPGGSGTEDMERRAIAHGLIIEKYKEPVEMEALKDEDLPY
jgi:hypothetical protein